MHVPLAVLAGGLALVDQLVWLFTPINRLVDEFHDSKEERAARRAEVTALQNEALALTLSLERERLMAQAAIVSAEAGCAPSARRARAAGATRRAGWRPRRAIAAGWKWPPPCLTTPAHLPPWTIWRLRPLLRNP